MKYYFLSVLGKCTFYNLDFKATKDVSQNTSDDGIIKSSGGEQ